MTEALTSFFMAPLWVFVAVLARISPVLVMTPPTRSSGVPMRIRAGLALAMSAMLTPLAMTHARPIPEDLINILICLAAEILLGMVIGCVVLMAVTALQLAGQSIGHLAGFDVAEAVDPNSDESMSVLASLMGWLAISLVLTLGGHRQIIDCCLESYTTFPAGMVRPQSEWLAWIDELMRHTLRIGIRAAAPIGIALLLANILTGLIARTLPQLSVLAVGFNINTFVMLVLLFLSLGSMAWVFQVELANWLNACHQLVSGTHRSTSIAVGR
jgi:flagellar biosynthetic protein FliR